MGKPTRMINSWRKKSSQRKFKRRHQHKDSAMQSGKRPGNQERGSLSRDLNCQKLGITNFKSQIWSNDEYRYGWIALVSLLFSQYKFWPNLMEYCWFQTDIDKGI